MIERFFGLAGEEVTSYCGDKEKFIGRYHGYGDPVGVINGDLGNSLNYNENGCGALCTQITLQPGEEKSIAYILGMKYEDEAESILESYCNIQETCNKELQELIDFWHGEYHSDQLTDAPLHNVC